MVVQRYRKCGTRPFEMYGILFAANLLGVIRIYCGDSFLAFYEKCRKIKESLNFSVYCLFICLFLFIVRGLV